MAASMARAGDVPVPRAVPLRGAGRYLYVRVTQLSDLDEDGYYEAEDKAWSSPIWVDYSFEVESGK